MQPDLLVDICDVIHPGQSELQL